MPSTTPDTASNSIGALLKTTREQRGMSQADAAAQLNLKVVIIEKLESEQWDTSMATTFVKGYLRAYARLLKLSEREILQAFDLQTAHLRKHTSEMHSFSRKTSREAADSRFMLATYGLVVLLIGLFFVWFWQTHLIDAEPVAVLPDYVAPVDAKTANNVTPDASLAAVPATHQSNDTAATTAPTQAVPQGATEPPASSSTSADVVPSALQATTTQATPAQATVAALNSPQTSTDEVPVSSIETTEGEARPAATQVPTTAGASTMATTQQPAISSVTSTVPTESVSSATTETTEPVSTNATPVTDPLTPAPSSDGVAIAATAQLQFSFSEDCWLSVLDANQQKIAYGLQKAGTSLTVSGQYPLRLTIGNASAATLQVQGKAYDMSQYKAGQVARIKLTGAE